MLSFYGLCLGGERKSVCEKERERDEEREREREREREDIHGFHVI